jgi:hypothetical protein
MNTKNICPVCKGSLEFEANIKICANCFSYLRLNIDLMIKLIAFFSIPAAFIVKGTGDFSYLLTGLIGAVIYLFNIHYVRDEVKTIRLIQETTELAAAGCTYFKKEMGPLDFIAINKTLFLSGLNLDSNQYQGLVHLISKQSSLVEPFKIEHQVELLSEFITIETFEKFCTVCLSDMSKKLSKLNDFHIDLTKYI